MSQENVELVGELFDLMLRRDGEAIFARYRPDIEWHDVSGWMPGVVYTGFDGVRAQWRDFLAAMRLTAIRPHDFVAAGDRVVVTVHTVGRGRASGIEVDREVSMVWTVRGAKVSRVEVFGERDEALAAAGLQE